jgi:hypothetical protein|tara:strand:- start:1002 stop:1145 length:144 start_codon:yes stop_codon:yes gene_type:complete
MNKNQKRLLQNALDAYKSSTDEWAQQFWLSVYNKLCKKYKVKNTVLN